MAERQPNTHSSDQETENSKEKSALENLQRHFTFITDRKIKSSKQPEVSAMSRIRNKKEISKFKEVENILLALPDDLEDQDQIVEYLEFLLSEAEDAIDSVSVEDYQDYWINRRDIISKAIEMASSFQSSSLNMPPFKIWDKENKGPLFNEKLYKLLRYKIDYRKEVALEQGDEASQYKYDRLADELVLVSNRRFSESPNPHLAKELIEYLEQEYINAHAKRQSYDSAGNKRALNIGMLNVDLRNSREQYEGLADSVFEDVMTNPHPIEELRSIVTELRRVGVSKAEAGVGDAIKLLEGSKKDINEWFWNDPDKALRIIEDARDILDGYIKSLSDEEEQVVGENSLPNQNTSAFRWEKLHRAKYRLEKFHSAVHRRRDIQWVPMGEAPRDAEFLEEEKAGRPWINKARERAYGSIIDEMEDALGEGQSGGDYFFKLLLNHLNEKESAKSEKLGVLTDEVRKGISLRVETLATESKLAGRPIRRPVFVIEDSEIYRQIEPIFDSEPGSSHGIHLHGGWLNHSDWQKVGLLITHDDMSTITHEIRHSIDPFLSRDIQSRTGYNELLAELFAEYTRINQLREGKDRGSIQKQESVWAGVQRLVSNDAYYKKYSRELSDDDVISKDKWRELVKNCVQAMQYLDINKSSDTAQEILAQSETVEQFLAAAN